MSNKHHYKIQTDFFLGGVQLAKNDFCLVFNLVLQKKNCSFQFGFSFTKLTVLSVFFSRSHSSVNDICHLCLCGYDARNDELDVRTCWIGPTNCRLKWLRTRSAEDKYFETSLLMISCWKMNCELKQCEQPSPNSHSRFLKTELWKLNFWFLNIEVGSVAFAL